MNKINVRVIGRPFRRTPPGEVLALSRRDARLLSRLGRVEILPSADDVAFSPSSKLDEAIDTPKRGRRTALSTPEAEVETVAHTTPPKRVGKRATKRRK